MAKIEVIKQQDLQDCGACCLSCIIQYYGGYVPISKIRDDSYTTATGTTAYHMIEAAKNYGFDAMGVKVDDIGDSKIYYPAIAHQVLKNGLNHFVVVYQVSKKYVWLMDPAKGKIKLKREEFEETWDHILILLNPISKIIKYDKNLTISSLLLNLISNNKFIFIKICLINLFLIVFTILGSFYFQTIISLINEGQDIHLLKIISLFFFCLILFKVILAFIKNYYFTYFYKNLDVQLFTDFFDHIFHLPLKYIQNRSTGEIISRVQDLSEIKDLLSEFFTNVLLHSILVIGSVVVLYGLCDSLLFVLCLVAIVYVIVGFFFSKFIYQKVKENISSATDFNSVLVEHSEMDTSIRNLNLISLFLSRLENKLVLLLKCNFKTQEALNRISFFKELVYEIGYFCVTTFGVVLIYQGRLELLSLITFNGILLYFFDPIRDFIDLIPKYNYLRASFYKLSEFINVEEELDKEGMTVIEKGSIEFQDVTYSYNQYTDVLHHVSFSIESGEKVFLVGPSGCGKSTVCNLLSFPDEIKNGIIKIDGVNAADYRLCTLRQEILYVGQNEKLFTGTIWENITCFREIIESDFLKVIKICQLEEFIDQRPNRYHTMINASINNLSGGERQRIILARALLKEAKILILDEALSEVNLEMERKIIDAIKVYYPCCTLIYVSHKEVREKFSKVINMEKVNA